MRKAAFSSLAVAVCTLLTLSASTASDESPADPTTATNEALAVYAELVKETELRRRVNVLYPNPQSIFDGLQIGYVGVRHGNLTFRRRDIVSGTNPLARIVRVYDSRIQTGRDFGPGWRLSLDEELIVKDGGLVYTDGSGARHFFARAAQRTVQEPLVSEQLELGAEDGDGPTPTSLASGVYTAFPSTPQHASTTIEVVGPLAILRKARETRVFENPPETASGGNNYRLTHLGSDTSSFVALTYRDGFIRSIADADGPVFELIRDGAGRITSIQDRWGREVHYNYDADGTLSGTTDIAGNAWAYEYATHGQLTRAIGPNERDILRITYDDAARVKESLSGRQYTFDYFPDSTVVAEGTGNTHLFGQNAAGITDSFDSTNGVWWQLSIDERNLVTAVHSSKGAYRYAYGPRGKITESIEAMPNGIESRAFQYDDVGRIESINSQEGGFTAIDYADGVTRINAPQTQFAFEVLSSGEISQVQHDGTFIRADYDADGNLAAFHNGTKTVQFNRDNLGRISAIQYANGEVNQYQYDQLGNRSSIDFSMGGAVRYTHDPAGNIVEVVVTEQDGEVKSQTVQIGDMNRVENITYAGLGKLDIAYDRIGRAIRFDAGGDVVSIEYAGADRISRIVSRATNTTWSPSDAEASEENTQEQMDARLKVLQNESSGVSHPYYGIAAFDESTFAVSTGDPMVLSVPGLREARQILAVAEPLFSDNEHEAMIAFEKPSNAVFQPLEYRSTNCCICIIVYPRYARGDSGKTQTVCICSPNPSPPTPSVSIITPPPREEWYIDNNLNMPSILFKAKLNNIDTGNALYLWKLLMEFKQNRRYFSHTLYGATTVPSWSPSWGSLVAGANKMTVSVTANVGGLTLTDSRSGYEIHGENPTKSQVFGLATSIEYKAVCWQESWHKQFGGSYRDRPYTGVELPLYGAPDGWGLMHEDPLPSERHLWDWEKNLNDGIDHLDDNYTEASTYLTTWYDEDKNDPSKRWSWNPREDTLEVWNDAFARYNTGRTIFSVNGNGGSRRCGLNRTGCNYADRVRGHMSSKPWDNY